MKIHKSQIQINFFHQIHDKKREEIAKDFILSTIPVRSDRILEYGLFVLKRPYYAILLKLFQNKISYISLEDILLSLFSEVYEKVICSSDKRLRFFKKIF